MRLQTLFEARWILAVLAVLAVLSAFFTGWLLLLFVLLILYTLFFFRDPDRGRRLDGYRHRRSR
jgi:hypothetical protein